VSTTGSSALAPALTGLIRLHLAACLAIGTLLAGVGCSSATTLKELGRATVALETSQSRTNVATKVGYLMTLELPPVELGGYGWQVFMHDARFLRQTTEITRPPPGATRPTVSFFALRATDKATVRFLLIKLDGAKEAQPVDAHDVIFMIE
jgi:hypothetical protein